MQSLEVELRYIIPAKTAPIVIKTMDAMVK